MPSALRAVTLRPASLARTKRRLPLAVATAVAVAGAVWKPAPVTFAMRQAESTAVEGFRARAEIDLAVAGGEPAFLGVCHRP